MLLQASDLALLEQQPPSNSEKKIVPNVAGLSQKEAVKKLEQSGLTVQIKGNGMVKSQSLKPGTRVQKQQKIILELS